MIPLRPLLKALFPYSLGLFLGFLCIRTTEFFRVDTCGRLEDLNFIYSLKGYVIDLLFSLMITAFFGIIQCLGFLLKSPRFLYVFHILALLALLANFGLSEIYLASYQLPDETLFMFSAREIGVIVGSGRFSVGMILSVAGLIALYFGSAHFLKRIRLSKSGITSFGISLLIAVVLSPLSYLESANSHLKTTFINNRLAFFTHRSIGYYWPQQTDSSIIESKTFAALDPDFYGGQAIHENYPLLHVLPEKSEFATYFHTSSQGPPNIVFLIVESLASELVAEKADPRMHMLPFLDSLSGQSLYFPNFLSTCERTHNVLPASLASVPNAPAGKKFMEMEYPHHWSLMSLLKDQYRSRFFCGVYLNFTNMDGFMKANQTQYLVQNWGKPSTSAYDGRANIWGYPDGEIFDKSWTDFQQQGLAHQRRLDVLLTISTHDPFAYPHANRYAQAIRKKVSRLKNPTKRELFIASKSFEFGSFAYLDDQLRAYFEKARKMAGYDNTIFLIMGDHGTQLAARNELSIYNVPLIIYSPLLKKPAVVRSVSTQLDLAPTLLNYLRLTYKMPLPSKVPFMGRELSFERQFMIDRTLAFNTYRCQNENLLLHNHYLFQRQLYRVGEGLQLQQVTNNEKLRRYLTHQLNLYGLLSQYTLAGDKLIPLLLRSEADSPPR